MLVRVDHNCVKGGKMTDAFRVDATIATLYNIVERGGRPILMSHVGRGLRPFIRFIKKYSTLPLFTLRARAFRLMHRACRQDIGGERGFETEGVESGLFTNHCAGRDE